MSGIAALDGTRELSAEHQLDAARLTHWLAQHVDGFSGPLSIRMFEGGQSNPTYKLDTPACSYVLRAKPGPAARLLPSAHAIEREYAVMRALHGSAVPVARMLALCEDESIVGRAFYVMEFLQGRVLWDAALPALAPAERGAVYLEAVRVLAALHLVDPQARGLAAYGKPGNYFERQIARWSRQYTASVIQPIASMDKLLTWLPEHLPPTPQGMPSTCLVHGDYRLDNLMFHPQEPRVLAVLDWELSTLGHPLADLSYHCMAWHIEPGVFRGIDGLDLRALGIPAESRVLEHYCALTGYGAPEALAADWNYYLAYNLFRIAAILQGVARRVQDGTASSAQARSAAAAAQPLADLAWGHAQAHAAGSAR